MKKISLQEADLQTVEKFISDVQGLFPKYKVDINNVNDFALMFEEKRNCSRCKGLEYCKNIQKGYYQEFDGVTFSYVECEYMKRASQKRSSLIKTLYLPLEILDASLESFDTNSDSRKKIYEQIVKNK